MSGSVIYFNGKIMSGNRKQLVDFQDPGFLYGQGLFETMRSYGGKIFCFKEHIRRIKKSAGLLNINIAESGQELQAATDKVLRKNKLQNAYLRLTCWQGGSKTNSLIFAKALPAQPKGIYKKGFRVLVSDYRVNEYSAAAGIKSSNYLNFYLAGYLARKKGYREAIMLNTRGFVAEGSRSNIFVVKDKALFTPSAESGCLRGITRGVILGLARKLKIKTKQAKITLKEMFCADEIFLTNSLIEVMPVTYVNSKKINKGIPGEITKILSAQYGKLTEK